MYDVEFVKRLSQEEGLNDKEISDLIHCSRTTITRIRKRNNIPKCNLSNKKDKSYICLICNKRIFIRRKEMKKAFCKDCKEKKDIKEKAFCEKYKMFSIHKEGD